MKPNPKDYIYWGRWNQPVLSWCFWEYWSLSEAAKNIPLDLEYEITPTLIIDGHHYIKSNGFYKNLKETFYRELSSSEKPLFDYFFQEVEKTDKIISNFIKKEKNSSESDRIKEVFDIHKQVMFSWAVIVPVNYSISKRAKELCEKYKIGWDKIIKQMPLPFEPLTFKDSKKLFEFKIKLEKAGLKEGCSLEEIEKIDKKLAQEIKDYQKETEYVGTHHFWGSPREVEEMLESIFLISSKKNKKVEKNIKIPQEVKEIAKISMAVTVWRLQLAEKVAQLEYSIRGELESLTKKIGITYQDIIFLTEKEVLNALRESEISKNKLNQIEERKKKFAGNMDDEGKLHIWTGDDYLEIEKLFNIKKVSSNKDSKKIKGTVGNAGIARGRVAIVFDPTEMDKVREESILVSPATSPDYLPAMRKAAAFVTDEGGVTSHAAIIAREMKKPCIIGTKIATQILKDGNLVEVDANNGIIKIIK